MRHDQWFSQPAQLRYSIASHTYYYIEYTHTKCVLFSRFVCFPSSRIIRQFISFMLSAVRWIISTVFLSCVCVCVYHIEKSPQQQLNMIAMCDVYLLYPSLVKEKLSSWLDVTFIYFSSPVLIYISSQRKKEKICFLFFFLPFSPLHTHQK